METLRRLRTEKGLSQARLAARAELDPSTVNQIERGAREASPTTLHKLADALDVSLYELLEGEPRPKAARSSLEPSLLNGLEDEREIRINYRACRTALDGFCDYWDEVLDADRLDLQALEDFNAAAEVLAPTYLELWGAEKTELGPQEDAGEPVFHSERSTLWPAIDRFIALGIQMDRIGRERFGRHGTAKVTDIFTKKAS
jgi:transcriptional regulator with XRE-family HTH domain